MEQEKTKVFHTMVMNIEKQQKEQQEKYELDFSQLRDQHKDIINQVADIKNEIQVIKFFFSLIKTYPNCSPLSHWENFFFVLSHSIT